MKWIIIGVTDFARRLTQKLNKIGIAVSSISGELHSNRSVDWANWIQGKSTVVVDTDDVDLIKVLTMILQLEENSQQTRFIIITSDSNNRTIFSAFDVGIIYNKAELMVESFLKRQSDWADH